MPNDNFVNMPTKYVISKAHKYGKAIGGLMASHSKILYFDLNVVFQTLGGCMQTS
jgi:hypothetical protein